MADRLFLNYQEEDEQGRLVGTKTLPFHLGVIGAFSGNRIQDGYRKPFRLNRANFNTFFTQCAPELSGYVINRLSPDPSAKHPEDEVLPFSLKFSYFHEFSLESIFSQLTFITDYFDFLERFEQCVGRAESEFSELFLEEDRMRLRSLGIDPDQPIEPLWVVHGLARGYARINDQINEVLYHPEYLRLEANWRSLWMLLTEISSESLRFTIMDVTEEVFLGDLGAGLDIADTDLFTHVYISEFDQYGGTPFSMIINTFELSVEEVGIAQSLGELGRISGCPMVSNVDASVFGVPSMDYLVNRFSFEDLRSAKHFLPWAQFGATGAARFSTLLLQKVCVRDPYPPLPLSGRGLVFYDRPPQAETPPGVYGVGGYAFVFPFLVTYARFQSCIAVEEPDNALIPKLYELNETAPSLSYTPLERLCEEVARFGFVLLMPKGGDGSLRFGFLNQFNANSSLEKGGNMISIEDRMNVRLPQLLFLCQITHYLRMIQRQSVAKHKPQQLKTELNSWLRRFVSDGSSDSPVIRAQRPLKRADVDVIEVEHKAGKMIEFKLNITPHSKFNGLEYELNF